MRIGETEVSDDVIGAELKKAGNRIVSESDFVSKAEQANLVAKARSILGDKFDNLDELARIVKAHEENENKSKSQLELALAANKEMEKLLSTYKGEAQKAKIDVRRREVDDMFKEAQEHFNTKVIEPILKPFKEDLYNVKEEEMQNAEFMRAAIKERLDRAAEIQKGELSKLGLAGISAEEAKNSSFGGGQVVMKESSGRQITGKADLWGISKETAATPMGIPLFAKKN